MSRPSLVALAVIPALAATGQAQTSEMQLQSLSIIPGVYVEVDGVNAQAQQQGLSPDSLRADIETLLGRAAITALTKPEWQQIIGNPGLHLSVQLLAASQHLYIYSMTLEVRQLTRLMRDSTKLVYTRTWGSGQLVGTVPSANLPSLRERARPLVARFISAYRAAQGRSRRRALGSRAPWNMHSPALHEPATAVTYSPDHLP